MTDSAPQPASTPPPSRAVGVMIVGLFILLFLMVLALAYLYERAARRRFAAAQPNPAAALQNLRAREAQMLDHYGYVERDKGIARIPIERAMELEARRPWHKDFPTTASSP
ncbi:MAG: hypothetical protein M1457_02290 [bacterium]|nr:hypothetical protein [bacterium]